MVKLEINELDATIQAKGSFAEISAQTMFLVDEFYSHIKRKSRSLPGNGPGMGERKF
jgi:hypothetical protein